MFRLVLISVTMLIISGCAQYKVGENSYGTAEEALLEQEKTLKSLIDSVLMEEKSTFKSITIYVPSMEDVERGLTYRGAVNKDAIDYVIQYGYRDYRYISNIIEKSNMFESINTVDYRGKEQPKLDKNQQALWFDIVGPNNASWKYYNINTPFPLTVPMDRALTDNRERLGKFLAELKKTITTNGGASLGVAPAGASSGAQPVGDRSDKPETGIRRTIQ